MQTKSRYTRASSRIQKRGRIKSFFYLFFWIAMPVFLLVVFILILQANFLQMKRVEVVGNVDIAKELVINTVKEQIAGQYFFVIPKSNYFFIKKDKIVQKLLKDFPRIENVKINKNLNDILEINLEEKQGDFVWCSTIDNQTCYLMSKDGSVFVEAKSEEVLGKIIFRSDLVKENPFLQNYLKVIDILKNAQFEVFEVSVTDKTVFKTNIGDIFLNQEEDMSLAVSNAIILINEIKVKTPSARFNYIDARFGNKMFYKLY